MYNRYIPQPDGSYQKKRVPDQSSPSQDPHDNISEERECPAQSEKHREHHASPSHQEAPPKCDTSPRESKENRHQGNSAFGFLSSLLPKDFDTGDLLIVLLLLLMAADCEDGQNTALLTLGLYLFM